MTEDELYLIEQRKAQYRNLKNDSHSRYFCSFSSKLGMHPWNLKYHYAAMALSIVELI